MEKAIVFDMDGVIFDTEILTQEALQQVSNRYGEGDVSNFFPTTTGVSIAEAKELYHGFFGKDYPYEQRRAEMREYIAEYVAKNGMPVKEGAEEVLSYLKCNNYKIALATSSSRPSVESHLKSSGFARFFDVVVCGDEIKNGKPAPDIYLTACKKLSVDLGDRLIIKNSYNGVRSAAAAGLKVFMIPDLNPANAEMKSLAFAVLCSIAELLKYL